MFIINSSQEEFSYLERQKMGHVSYISHTNERLEWDIIWQIINPKNSGSVV